jgi:hypothetical protein
MMSVLHEPQVRVDPRYNGQNLVVYSCEYLEILKH